MQKHEQTYTFILYNDKVIKTHLFSGLNEHMKNFTKVSYLVLFMFMNSFSHLIPKCMLYGIFIICLKI